jgi:hypothetical protein
MPTAVVSELIPELGRAVNTLATVCGNELFEAAVAALISESGAGDAAPGLDVHRRGCPKDEQPAAAPIPGVCG